MPVGRHRAAPEWKQPGKVYDRGTDEGDPGDRSTPTHAEIDPVTGLTDAIVIGLGSMFGAGVFSALAPAAQAAGTGLLIGLAIAAVIAYCNATSSARLAARYPDSGGTYVYGRERLGPFWGYLAGWGFVVGKTASCAAMALTVVAYAVPTADRWVRTIIVIAVVAALTVLNYFGVQKSAWLTRVIVAITLVVLVLTVIGCLTGGTASTAHLLPITGTSVGGVLQAGGLLFFAFAGYARIATLGEEVRDPARTIPRAIPIALSIVLVVYAAVAVAALLALGPTGLAAAVDPLAQAVAVGSWSWMVPVVRVGAAVAAFGSFSRAAARGVPDHPCDGPRRAPAGNAGGGAPAVWGAAPRRDHRRDRRRAARQPGRPARSDRVLLVRGAGVLRGRQRLRMDAAPRDQSAHRARARPDRLPHHRVQPAHRLRHRRRVRPGHRLAVVGDPLLDPPTKPTTLTNGAAAGP